MKQKLKKRQKILKMSSIEMLFDAFDAFTDDPFFLDLFQIGLENLKMTSLSQP